MTSTKTDQTPSNSSRIIAPTCAASLLALSALTVLNWRFSSEEGGVSGNNVNNT